MGKREVIVHGNGPVEIAPIDADPWKQGDGSVRFTVQYNSLIIMMLFEWEKNIDVASQPVNLANKDLFWLGMCVLVEVKVQVNSIHAFMFSRLLPPGTVQSQGAQPARGDITWDYATFKAWSRIF